MVKNTPVHYRQSKICIYCKYCHIIDRKDSRCLKHDFDLQRENNVYLTYVCDDFEPEEQGDIE